jgi:hypothetical protein
VILSWLQHGKHPEDIEQELVDRTMQIADEAAIDWTREVEIKEVRSRIIAQFETAVRDAKAPPPWLPAEFADRAIRILDEGSKISASIPAAGICDACRPAIKTTAMTTPTTTAMRNLRIPRKQGLKAATATAVSSKI